MNDEYVLPIVQPPESNTKAIYFERIDNNNYYKKKMEKKKR